jgi:hypothetical protein
VWKPLHYGLGRWFADLALSVRHDLHNDTIQVSAHCFWDSNLVLDVQHNLHMQHDLHSNTVHVGIWL